MLHWLLLPSGGGATCGAGLAHARSVIDISHAAEMDGTDMKYLVV